MDHRRATRTALVAALACAAGCAASPPLPAVGASHAPRDVEPESGGAPPRPRWELADEAAAWPRVGAAWFPSRGHFVGRRVAEVHVAPVGAAAYAALSPSTDLVPGTAIAERTRVTPTGAPGPTLVMVRRDAGFDPDGGDWEYVVVDAEGGVAARGPLPACRRCHAEAPFRFLFGAPAEAPAAP